MNGSGVHDFLGRELNVGDVIVYPVCRASSADMVKAEIVEFHNVGMRVVSPTARVRRLQDSARRRVVGTVTTLYNLDRCVRVDKRSPVTVDMPADH